MRSALWLLIGACAILTTVAFPSAPARRYAPAQHWLEKLREVDLENWSGLLHNRQTVVLGGVFAVERLLSQEAERANLPVSAGRILQEQVTLGVHPSAAEVRSATLETLLTRVFRNVETPQLFYPDREVLSTRLQELFSQGLASEVQGLVLSRVVLELDNVRGKPGRALLRLEWRATSNDTAGAARSAVTREIPVAGSYKDELQDFDGFVRDMNPELLLARSAAGGQQPWPLAVRGQLSPIWGEIRGKTLAAASTHVQARLTEARGDVALFGLRLKRTHILACASVVLFVVQGALWLSLRRLDRLPRSGGVAVLASLWTRSLPVLVAWVLTFLFVVIFPVITFGTVIAHFAEAELAGATTVAVLTTGVSVFFALQALRSILSLRRPQPSAADKQRLRLIKEKGAAYRRATARTHRAVGGVLLGLGCLAGPVGAFMLSLYLLGAGLGAEHSGIAPLLAILLSPVLVAVGWVLAAGRKKLVLFLRRFRNEALNDAVRELTRAVLRRRARLITLDDSSFAPLGPRWQGLVPSLMPSGIVFGALAVGYSGFAKVAKSEALDGTPFGTALILILLGIQLVGFVAGLVALLQLGAALRAHFAGHRRVHDAASRVRVVRRLQKLRSFLLAPVIAAPMATVVSVTDAEWQATVASIAPVCDVTLVDISEARESIRWEIATLREAGVRIILLAQREARASWWNLAADQPDGPLADQLRSLVAGLPLIDYDAPERLEETELLELLSTSGSHDNARA